MSTTTAPVPVLSNKPLPVVPLAAANTWSQIEALYDQPGYALINANFMSKKMASPHTISKAFNELPGVASLLEKFYYVAVEEIFVDMFASEEGTLMGVAITSTDPGSNITFATLRAATTQVCSRGSTLVSGSSIIPLGFHQGLSRQLSPTPVDGKMPYLQMLCGSTSDNTASIKVMLVLKFRGPYIATVDF